MTSAVPADGLSSSQRAAVVDLIVADQERTAARVAALTRDFDAIVESSAIAPPDDEHDPEGSTVAFERAQVSALLDQARNHLVDLERALERLRHAIYGTCRRCGRPIMLDRLLARPTAETCVGCAGASR